MCDEKCTKWTEKETNIRGKCTERKKNAERSDWMNVLYILNYRRSKRISRFFFGLRFVKKIFCLDQSEIVYLSINKLLAKTDRIEEGKLWKYCEPVINQTSGTGLFHVALKY